MTNIASQKRMAAEILKCGKSRIRITLGKDVEEALTREDVRNLIRKGSIKKVQKKGSSRAAARKTLAQKKKGRRKGMGSRKGRMRARMPRKKEWMTSVKTLRAVIKDLRDSGRIERKDYRLLYRRVKGGMFRNRKHILLYLKEHEFLVEGKAGTAKTVKSKKSRPGKTGKTKAKPAKNKQAAKQVAEKKGSPRSKPDAKR